MDKRTNISSLEFIAVLTMLHAIGNLATENNFTAWLSLDENMVCGVGAYLTCVIKLKKQMDGNGQDAVKISPIFESREVLWNE